MCFLSVSGGIRITMKGSNLHAAARPMLGGKYKNRDTGVYEVRQDKNRDTGVYEVKQDKNRDTGM